MEVSNSNSAAGGLPVKYNLSPAYIGSLVAAVLMAVSAAAGLTYSEVVYPSEELLVAKVPTDLITLVIGLPVLLVSLWLARRGKLSGLLLWPGALCYGLYIYLAYLFSVPFNLLFPLYLMIVPVSLYTLIGQVVSIDAETVSGRLAGAAPTKAPGLILISLAVLFGLMQLVELVSSLINQTLVSTLKLAPMISDFTVMIPAWLIGGIMLWRRQALGYVVGTGLLFLGSILFIGVIPVMVYPSLVAGTPVDVSGIVVVLTAGLICFVPFVLYLRAVGSS